VIGEKMKQQKEAMRLLEEALNELESSKGSIFAAIQKLSRASSVIGNNKVFLWCQIQFGDQKLSLALKEYVDAILNVNKESSSENKREFKACEDKLRSFGLEPEVHYPTDELEVKHKKSGGGFVNIGFIEEKYADLVRRKSGNDGTYYKSNLAEHLVFVRKKAHELAAELYNEIKFSGTVSNCFEILKNAVDDRLLDLQPTLAEQLMVAFKAISSKNIEEWSQALTSCRRLLEGLADQLQPVTKENVNGRNLGQGQYVNRLWAFMDKSIESDSNKALAKTHVDFLGAWLEKVNKITNKGVHSELDQLEAIKAVFHTYLVVADILSYLKTEPNSKSSKPDINNASIDELEVLLGVNRNVAKEIFKYRIKEGCIDCQSLSSINGVGPKTLQRAKDEFEIAE
jgi:DNA uptake protein ComE-like DNA-binding protein/uncharacterized coiled-coil protein SlyX